MRTRRVFIPVILILALSASACDLLGIGGKDRNNAKEKSAKPRLVWKLENAVGSPFSPSPVIEDSSIYLSDGYDLVKLALHTGNLQWSAQFDAVSSDLLGNILIDGTAVYLRFEQSVKAYDKSDGSLMWKVSFEDSLFTSQLARSTSLVDQSGKRIFVGSRKELLIIDKSQEAIEQTIPVDMPGGTVADHCINVPKAGETGDRVYLLTSCEGQNSSWINSRLAAYRTADGSRLWKTMLPYQLPNTYSVGIPQIIQMREKAGQLIVMTGPAVLAYDKYSGEQDWEYQFYKGKTDINIGSLLAVNKDDILALADKRVIILSADNGREKQQISTNLLGSERMVFKGGDLYLSGGILPGDTFITVYDAKTGDNVYSLSPPEKGLIKGFTPAFDTDGEFTIDVGATSIYAYRVSN
ncbi:MAG TPA: PQQ-binding-like beta-propeller repeat protein [Balneolaceae bacterium]|nr:PQQ-binding-like beta-propeller repeat protein [Balneolaceae bacterium]